MFGLFRRLIKSENDRPANVETGPESEAEAALILRMPRPIRPATAFACLL